MVAGALAGEVEGPGASDGGSNGRGPRPGGGGRGAGLCRGPMPEIDGRSCPELSSWLASRHGPRSCGLTPGAAGEGVGEARGAVPQAWVQGDEAPGRVVGQGGRCPGTCPEVITRDFIDFPTTKSPKSHPGFQLGHPFSMVFGSCTDPLHCKNVPPQQFLAPLTVARFLPTQTGSVGLCRGDPGPTFRGQGIETRHGRCGVLPEGRRDRGGAYGGGPGRVTPVVASPGAPRLHSRSPAPQAGPGVLARGWRPPGGLSRPIGRRGDAAGWSEGGWAPVGAAGGVGGRAEAGERVVKGTGGERGRARCEVRGEFASWP
ncbi:hypothetical protein N7475_001059 [Penicillium sp. IBT 31633x]|nr:hypothetical protein N7475_001059 [Penicillium sp. IBT 31633x]